MSKIVENLVARQRAQTVQWCNNLHSCNHGVVSVQCDEAVKSRYGLDKEVLNVLIARNGGQDVDERDEPITLYWVSN